jgi:PAS domain S-box-containing protein
MLVERLERRVSERREAEAALREVKKRFEEMANLLPETIYEMDESGVFTYLNRSGFERFGYDSEDLKNRLKFIELFTSQDRNRIEKNFNSVMSGNTIGSSEYLVKTKIGTTFQALVHFNPIIQDRKIRGVRGIAVDITERKRIEKELLIYQDKLRSLTNELLSAEERERRRIASQIHDRIGHVLTNVSLKIGLLSDINNINKQDEILKQIKKLIEQSAQDVQSLIFEISPPILYDIGLVAAIDWLTEQMMKEHKLKIAFNYDDELKSLSNNLRVLIFRGVNELLYNVVKHANADYVEILITRREKKLIVSVRDNGIGIPEDSATTQSGIEGFGLFSIRERLSHLNGHLIISSRLNHGTLVVMEIPVI